MFYLCSKRTNIFETKFTCIKYSNLRLGYTLQFYIVTFQFISVLTFEMFDTNIILVMLFVNAVLIRIIIVDRTVKIWDLQKGAERQTLTGHANNVVAVRYLPSSHMLLSASSAFVKVWDIRTSDARCVKVLW